MDEDVAASDRPQPGAAHESERGLVPLEHGKDAVVVPAGVPEFDRDSRPGRHQLEEVPQPGLIAHLVRSELQEEHGAWVSPRGALTENWNPSGSRRRLPGEANWPGQRYKPLLSSTVSNRWA